MEEPVIATQSIYTMQCAGDYYVGRAKDVKTRIADHNAGFGAAFTKRHSKWELVESFPMTSECDEDNTTLRYMNTFGIENVRGGSYATETLSSSQLESIRRSLDTMNNACYKCHETGHYAPECPARSQSRPRTEDRCHRCKQTGHWARQCPTLESDAVMVPVPTTAPEPIPIPVVTHVEIQTETQPETPPEIRIEDLHLTRTIPGLGQRPVFVREPYETRAQAGYGTRSRSRARSRPRARAGN